jgi:small GTP-binding protein
MNGELKQLTLFILGNSSVGKTSFIHKYVKNDFKDSYKNTIGIDYCSRNMKLPTGEEFEIFFYDTAGQEKYKSISFNLIKKADGILLLYDISERSSFDDINQWIENIKNVKGDNFPVIMIGNKCDLEERDITQIEGELFANEHGFSFEETSCKEGINIEESVQDLVLNILEKKKKENLKENFTFKLSKKKEKKKKCCK